MALTPNMGMNQTVQGVTAGPAYATQIDANWVTLDNHDHSAGKGLKVTPAGLNINADLSLGGNNLTNGAQLNGTSAHVSSVVATAALTLTSSTTATTTALIVNNTVTLTSGKLFAFQNNGTEQLSMDGSSNLNLTGGSILQKAAGTSLILKGNATSAGIGIILDNPVAITGGSLILSVRSNGVEAMNIAGNSTMTIQGSFVMNGTLIIAGGSSGATLRSSASAANTGWTTNNTTTLTAGGKIHSFQNNGTEQAYIGFEGGVSTITHFLSNGTNPTSGTFAAGFGSVTANLCIGGDAAFILQFNTGTATLIAANVALFTITLANGYASSNFVATCSSWLATGVLSTTGYYCVPTAATTFIVYNLLPITPANATQYKLQLQTMGAGVAN